MNQKLAISTIALFAVVMGLGAVTPAMAMASPPLYLEGCIFTQDSASCSVVVDADRNGCDSDDRRITLPFTAVQAAGIASCPAPPR